MNKIVYTCKLLRISLFKRCVKEHGVAAVFMFELTLFQTFGPILPFICSTKRYIQCHLRFSVIVI